MFQDKTLNVCIETCLPSYELIKVKIENEVFMIVEVTEVIKMIEE